MQLTSVPCLAKALVASRRLSIQDQLFLFWCVAWCACVVVVFFFFCGFGCVCTRDLEDWIGLDFRKDWTTGAEWRANEGGGMSVRVVTKKRV